MTDILVIVSHALDPDSVRRWVAAIYDEKLKDDDEGYRHLKDRERFPLLDAALKEACEKIIEGSSKHTADLLNDRLYHEFTALNVRHMLWIMACSTR